MPKKQELQAGLSDEYTVVPYRRGETLIIRLPDVVSASLPSRGAVSLAGTVNGIAFRVVAEPNGDGGHWFPVDSTLREAADARAEVPVLLRCEPSEEWPEIEVPEDLRSALAANRKAMELWERITPLARLDWIRWIRSTKNRETRARRIAAACDKLVQGERRVCCFDRNRCSDPAVSRGGRLLGPQKGA